MGWLISELINKLTAFILDLVASLMESLTSIFSTAFGSSPAAFQTVFPAIANFQTAFKAIGMALIICLFLLGCFRNMFSGLGFLGENPFKMAIRTVIAFVLVFCLYDGMSIFYSNINGNNSIFGQMYASLQSVEVPDTASVGMDWGSDALSILTGGGSAIVGAIITAAFMIVILLNFLKLLIEMFERYLMVNLLIFFSPLVGAAVTLESTIKIFQSYLKMFFGQMMMILMNLISLKIIQSGIETASVAFSDNSSISIDGISAEFVPYIILLLVIAMLKIAQRLDNYMRDIGMTVGINGGSLVDEILATKSTLAPVVGSISGGKGGNGTGIMGALGRKNFFTSAKSGIIGGTYAAAKNMKDAVAMKHEAGNPNAEKTFSQRFGSAHTKNDGSLNASNIMKSNSPISNQAMNSTAAKRGASQFVNDLSGGKSYNGSSTLGVNPANVRNAKVNSGATVGIDKDTGHVVGFSYKEPSFKDSSLTSFKDKSGQTVYAQDLTNANAEYGAANGGKTYGAYENACNVYNNGSTVPSQQKEDAAYNKAYGHSYDGFQSSFNENPTTETGVAVASAPYTPTEPASAPNNVVYSEPSPTRSGVPEHVNIPNSNGNGVPTGNAGKAAPIPNPKTQPNSGTNTVKGNNT